MKLPSVFLALLLAAAPLHAASPFLETVDLFKAGDGGYKFYHIPGIVVTAKGTVLAWAEARKNGSDWDTIDILTRRSTDDGKTWGEPTKLPEVAGAKAKNPFSKAKPAESTGWTYNNPVLIADRDGTVHGLFCLEYMRAFYTRSADDGLTWSAPVEITGSFEGFRTAYDWKVLATGPNHGIQLKNGRLVVPVWLSLATGSWGHHPSVTATIFSDDAGKTWKTSEIAVPNTEEWIDPNETTAVELSDGSVMLNVRNEAKANRRLVTVSKDGATGWSKPRFDDALVEPICMASLVRLSTGPDRILFSNPDNLTRTHGEEAPGKGRDRKNVTIRLSYDEGWTWPVKKSLDPAAGGYSDLAVTPAGTILCFFGKPDRLLVARTNLEWLTDGQDSLTKK
ncbi:MAG TPA: sialidase family protein [Chthoniobacteraceae bacterium]|jgi:sialidase-1|nr:sialidase family protein [Chthoniobacteraceae bacterium]